MITDERLYEHLKLRPAVLFLGQDYLRSEGRNPFLDAVLKKFGTAEPSTNSGFLQLLDTSAAQDVEAALAWMHSQSQKICPAESLKTVGSFAWNALYTSAIDDVWVPAFRLAWRDLQPIFDDQYIPADPRNRLLLHSTYLFGSVSQTDPAATPPLTRIAWLRRRQVAVALSRRLPEVLTPLGSLLIEGYDPNRDWFAVDELVPLLDSLQPGHVHWFSFVGSSNRDVDELVRAGKLVTHSESLSEFLRRGEELGHIPLGAPPRQVGGGRIVRLHGQQVAVPPGVWSQTSRSGIVVDESALAAPPPLSPDAEYQAFRTFLGTSEGRPLWSAYARGFAFEREFESELQRRVTQRLDGKRLSDRPIILRGSTATGKTVALGRLAFNIAQQGQCPVIYVERKTRRPATTDIDRFCQWAEDLGAPATLIIWDAMSRPEDYVEFLRHLSSRGRKAVLVGSCYRATAAETDLTTVEAPEELTTAETKRFSDFLVRFHPDLAHLTSLASKLGKVFLEGLYRLLPPTRVAIRDGVVREVGDAEAQLLRRAAELHTEVPTNTLQEALLKAGLLKTPLLDLGRGEVIGDDVMTVVNQLTGLVMVPGQFGLKVPLELLMRAIGHAGKIDIAKLFESIDVIRWFEDEVGNYEVGPRNSLEARLLVQARLGKADPEIAFVKKLILAVQERDTFGEDREINFAVDLLRSVGPQSGKYFGRFFRELSGTLKELRETRGTLNPRLMLQEANLLRAWAIEQTRDAANAAMVDDAFEELEQVLRKALDLAAAEHRSTALHASLLTELATALASRARHNSRNPSFARGLFDEARNVLLSARRMDPRNYYPVDVLSWATRDMIDFGVLAGAARTEAIVDLVHAFQTSDPNEFESEQLERFHVRRLELGDLLRNQEMSDDAFAELEKQGSKAGYYLRARRMAGLPESAADLNPNNLARIDEALKYLRDHYEFIGGDGRCLDLFLDLWWLANARQRFFEAERVTLPFSQQQWNELLKLTASIELTGQSHRTLLLRFLSALALFHVGDIEQCVRIFKDLESEAEEVLGRRRVVRSYLAGDAHGRTAKFHGTISWISTERNRGDVAVQELRRKIGFLPRDFSSTDPRRGSSLGEFHIAFNFLGPIADPVTRVQ